MLIIDNTQTDTANMKTFISWLIANLETVALVILCVVFGLLFLNTETEVLEQSERRGLFIGIFVVMVTPAAFTSKNFSAGLILFALIAAGYLYLIVNHTEISADPVLGSGLLWMFVFGTVSLVAAIAVGIFTAVNMDDVVSRRMLYVNSDVSMFEMTLLYSLNRFMVAFSYFSWAGLWTAVYMMIK